MKPLLSILLLSLGLNAWSASPGLPYFVLDRPQTPYQQRIGVYYKFDDPTGATNLVDQISGLDMYPLDANWPALSVTGQISTAVEIGAVQDLPDIYNWYAFGSLSLTNSPDWDAWNLNSNSFTIRLWFRTPDSGEFNVFGLGNIRLDYHSDRTFTFSLYSGITAIDGGSLPATNWHRVICFWDRGVSIGIKIDDGTTSTLTTTETPDPFSSSDMLTIGQQSGAVRAFIDELGIWKYKWTESDMTLDWNGGLGRTYPF